MRWRNPSLTPCWTTWLLALALLLGQAAAAASAETKDPKKGEGVAAKKDAKKTPAKEEPAKKDAKKPAAKPKDAKTAPAAKEEAESKPATYRVKKGPFRIELALDGVFQAEKTADIFVRPQEWPALTVLKAAEHGATVKTGDLILTLDPEKIDHAIADLRADLKISDLALKQAEEQMRAMEKLAPLDLESASRAGQNAAEDWKEYEDVDKPMLLKIANFSLKMAQDALDYQEEEYRQLEKMYRANDLTEETEKIVLKRARDGVDRAKFNLEYSKTIYEETKKFALPRREDRVRDATRRAEIDAARTKITLPLAISKQQLELEKLKILRNQSEERLGKLLADRAMMTVKAPMDGVVYYGHFVRGKWLSGLSADPFRRGASVAANDVLMTVVALRPLAARASVPESQVRYLRAGVQGIAVPGGFPGMKLTAIVHSVSAVPISGTNFDAQFTLGAEGLTDAIVPGMTCDLKFLVAKQTDALCIPPKAVFSEELDLTKQFVYVLGKDGKPQKRPVTLGNRNDKQVEILQGLSAGDQILLEKPKDKD